VDTRWNSTYSMLSKFREQKKVVLSIELDRIQQQAGFYNQTKRSRQNLETIPSSIPHISCNDFELLKHLCPIMKLFDAETKKFSKEKSTASTIIPTLRRLRDFLQGEKFPESVCPFARDLANAINAKVSKLANNRILRMASIVDPRFAFAEELWNKKQWAKIEDELIEFAYESKNF